MTIAIIAGILIAVSGIAIVNLATTPPGAYLGMGVFVAGVIVLLVTGGIWILS